MARANLGCQAGVFCAGSGTLQLGCVFVARIVPHMSFCERTPSPPACSAALAATVALGALSEAVSSPCWLGLPAVAVPGSWQHASLFGAA